MRMLIAAALLVLVAACQGIPGSTAPMTLTDRVILACNARAEALNTLATARALGSLSPDEIAQVNLAVEITNPICTTGALPAGEASLRAALDTVQSQLDVLTGIDTATE